MDSNMNSYLCSNIATCGIDSNASSKETLKKFNSRLQKKVYQRETQTPDRLHHENQMEAEKKNMLTRSISDPKYMNSGYENFDTKKLFDDVTKERLKECRTQSESVFNSHRPKSNSSTEKLRDFLITHADFLNSLYEKDSIEADHQTSNTKQDNLPAELWWVPPLNIPTSRSVPSVKMSSAGYSGASSIASHSKTKRSVEDLRQRVDSVCDLVEAMGILEPPNQTKDSTEFSVPKKSYASSLNSIIWPVPSLKISPNSSEVSLKSLQDMEQFQPTSYKTVPSHYTVLEPKSSTCQQSGGGVGGGSATLRHSTFNASENSNDNLHTKLDFEGDALDNGNELRSTVSFAVQQPSLSVSDLACIHIVNPMLSKLARLCTAQGQQYLTVLEELEKACNDFHKACKSQSVGK